MKKSGTKSKSFNLLEMFSGTGTGKKLFTNRWNVEIVRILGAGAKRFTAIDEQIEISRATLNNHLKFLCREGLLQRKACRTVPPTVEYSLTELGKKFLTVLESLEDWKKGYCEYASKRAQKNLTNNLDVKRTTKKYFKTEGEENRE